MSETTFALTDANGLVVDTIVASPEYIKELEKNVSDPNVDTGPLVFAKAYDVTGQRVARGHKRAADGKWTAPEPEADVPRISPKPTQAQLAEQAAKDTAAKAQADAQARQRAEDDAFVKALQTKQGKQPFTQDERDRMNLILLSRGITPA